MCHTNEGGGCRGTVRRIPLRTNRDAHAHGNDVTNGTVLPTSGLCPDGAEVKYDPFTKMASSVKAFDTQREAFSVPLTSIKPVGFTTNRMLSSLLSE